MELGEKLRKARLEAGLSQRTLCGGEITRNMLSQIENGTARPSMKTLQYLAARLGKPVSFFLEEGASASPNQLCVFSARRCFDDGNWQGVLERLQNCQEPDEVYDRERALLWSLSCLNLAEEALNDHREIYARKLLEQADIPVSYCADAIRRRRLLLLARLGETVSKDLPSLDEELLVRGRECEDPGRGAELLGAVENRSPYWHLLRGQLYLGQKAYREAVRELQIAEEAFPNETVPRLELAFRELGDYEKAYFYACKARGR